MTRYSLLLLAVFALCSCTKRSTSPTTPAPGNGTDTVVPVTIPTDPPLAKTIGFFLDNWQPLSFARPAYTEAGVPAAATTTVTIDASTVITKIPTSVFGHNAV